MPDLIVGEETLERMVRAVEKVRDRLKRATAALEQHNIPYAVVGGNAVATWVATVDEAAVRNTPDVDIVLRRSDLEIATVAFTEAGFLRCHDCSPISIFVDRSGGKARDSVNVLLAGEKIRESDMTLVPDVDELGPKSNGFRVISLKALVQMELSSFRIKDRVHLRDLLDVGLIDDTWPAKLPPELGARLQELIDTPDG